MRSFTRSAVQAQGVNPLATVQPRQQHGLDHADDRFNRAGAARGIRRVLKFRQFETNEFTRADELAHQRA